ncbi:(Fe-S)-binding protein [Amphritea sp.]|uniref:(Fe-S)-binding protein n=1 Tax=Amphritea sp. TaxID=1872502 RepID=UPI003D0D2561
MKPNLDWSDYESAGLGDAYADIPKTGGNFAKAVSVCINSLVCLRPVTKSVMCPSFRVRQDAAFSPGGRSRLLKRLLNDEITAAEKQQLDEAMRACVGCKGCKRECESGLDLAAIRAEYLAQPDNRSPYQLRDRLFANLPLLLRFPSLLRAGVALRNRSPLISGWLERYLGISARVALPIPSRHRLAEVTPGNAVAIKENTVLMLTDSLSRGFSPEIFIAAQEVMARAGYDVRFLGARGGVMEGRSWFSSGNIDQARQQASRLLDELTPYIASHTPIIGLEPSSALMLRDEYLQLGLNENATALAKNVYLFEEFIAREISAGRFNLPQRTPIGKKVLVHGHCHQKAVGAMKSVRKVLKLIPELEFEFIDASCCGGGGSFAYEKEHQQDSEKMFNLALQPALAAEPDALVVANGFSCRSQILHYAERKTLHLAELLQMTL